MNLNRSNISVGKSYEYKGINFNPILAEVITLESKQIREDKKASVMTEAYLNEKLAYFYNHGGPIMEL